MKHLRELTSLASPSSVSEAANPTEQGRRAWLGRVETQIEALEELLNGAELENLLKAGGFPETESKAMKEAFSKFYDEFDDLKMGLLSEFWESE